MTPNVSLQSLFDALASIPDLAAEMRREFAEIKQALAKPIVSEHEDGWMDAKDAAKYLSVSPATFDKYRYQTTPKIKGYPLDGKVLYKRSDLDTFVRLYALKSSGLA